jgi:hypothetical protein
MALWWVGIAIFIVVVIPVVVILLQRLANSAVDVGKRVDTVHGQVAGIVVAVNDVQQLIPVRDTVKRAGAGLTRYAKAVSGLL